MRPATLSFFFFNDTATTEIYTLSLHDALPISEVPLNRPRREPHPLCDVRRAAQSLAYGVEYSLAVRVADLLGLPARDRKSTRLNSSHGYISYAVFCLKKKRLRCRPRCTERHTF